MNKNTANTYRFVIVDSAGQGITGLTPTITLAQDSATTFSAATNTPSEVNENDAPGLYEIDLTQAECNCDTLTIRISLPNGQTPAILDVVQMQTSGGSTITPADVWGYSTRTLTAPSLTAQQVWEYTTRSLTDLDIQSELTTYGAAKTSDLPSIAGLATSAALADVATTANGIKSKTDNLPASPAATGDIPTVANIQSGLAKTSDLSGLSTFNPSTDTVTINIAQAATMTTATGFATPANVTAAQNAIVAALPSDYAKPTDIPTVNEIWGRQAGDTTSRTLTNSPDIQSELTTYGAAKTVDVPTAQDVWTYSDRELTSEIAVEISNENIRDITNAIWDADDRTLTDLTPRPNQRNIVCSSTNVLNSYGIQRLEDWTNETAGTPAFDTIVTTYITLAKEKMTTDLNNHINAAINYIGADMITELCSWLTGYLLYAADESRGTDNLAEQRYYMYIEQIHKIMENV